MNQTKNGASKLNRRTVLASLGAAGCEVLTERLFSDNQFNSALDQLLPHFSTESRRMLVRVLTGPTFGGQIPADVVRRIAATEGRNIDGLMVDLLPVARSYASAPVSRYHVGAVASGSNRDLYLGANFEVPGQALGFTVHAEQAAFASAYMHRDRAIARIVLAGAPCGHCRQFMEEFSPDGALKVQIANGAALELSVLLPVPFGPKELGIQGGAFSSKDVNLRLSRETTDELTVVALEAARRAYTPYTKSYSGIAILTNSGRVYSGTYIESVAFNPSLSPFQAALVSLVIAGEDNSAISRVVLVELDHAPISQKAVTTVVLRAIAPGATLDLATAQVTS